MASTEPYESLLHTKIKVYWIFVLLFVITLSPTKIHGIVLRGTQSSYAMYPKWNACINASLSFEFSTRQDEGLLMYVDDGGRYDFFQIVHKSGRVTVSLNIVDGTDGKKEITVGNNVNDGRWHRVEIRRNRMETTLLVDKVADTSLSFGTDFYFGQPETNSNVFFGGLPVLYDSELKNLALPSALYIPRYKGRIRNVLYSNCTCQTTRANYISGEGVDLYPPEACDRQNDCREGCVCISTDSVNECDCSELQCVTGSVTHYRLPMDHKYGTTLINPSGLDAKAYGGIIRPVGVWNSTILLDGSDQYIQVAGPGHKDECFGDLQKCSMGYTMSYWMNFAKPHDGEMVYLSNGGHTTRCHGVAQFYDQGRTEFVFRTKDGKEWRVRDDNILPGRWYHFAVSWLPSRGLTLYVNGEQVDVDASPVVRSPRNIREDVCKEFFIGNTSGTETPSSKRQIMVDEFNFWSKVMDAKEIREHGPFTMYLLNMESMSRGEIAVPNSNLKLKTTGRPDLILDGKVGKALRLNGNNQYADGGDVSNTCLGDLNLCQYGVTVAAWMKFNEIKDGTYIFDTGNSGVKLYVKDNNLVAEAQQGEQHWKTSWDGIEPGIWHYVELTWHPTDKYELSWDNTADGGLKLFVNNEQVAHDRRSSLFSKIEGNSKMLIGRSNSDLTGDSTPNMVIDEMEILYGDRQRLSRTHFIARGRPQMYLFDMNRVIDYTLDHPFFNIILYGNPINAPGKFDNALELTGEKQYAKIESQADKCLGNLDLCPNGVLLAGWIQPGQFSNGMELLSTGINGLYMWYEGGRLRARAETMTRIWEVDTPYFDPNKWQFLELSWDPKTGFKLYSNNNQMASNNRARVRSKADSRISNTEFNNFYIGKGSGRRSGMKYGNFLIDELEYWYGNRDYLLAHNYIQRGRPESYLIKMDAIRNRKVVHPNLNLPVLGNPRIVRGKINGALRLNGNQQYLDVGDHFKNCYGDLTKCHHGITGSMWVNFKNFRDNMYYLSNGGGIRIFHKNGRLYFIFQTPGKEWQVPINYPTKDKWQFIEYTWHPDKGLQVYVDHEKVIPESKTPKSIPIRTRDPDNHHYIGRSNVRDTVGDRFTYGDFDIDHYKTWFAHRDYLLAHGYIHRENITHFLIPLEDSTGVRVRDINLKNIILHNNAYLMRAKMGNGVTFDGTGPYMTLGQFPNQCFTNLEQCHQGIDIKFFLYPRSPRQNEYYLSSKAYSVYYKDNKLWAEFSDDRNTWTVSSDKLRPRQWNLVEATWDKEQGLRLYVDNKIDSAAEALLPKPKTEVPRNDDNVYVGRAHSNSLGVYANAIVDEIDVRYESRQADDSNNIIIPMDSMQGDLITHPDINVTTYGKPTIVQGVIDGAIYLNGIRQYVDIGKSRICGGDLNNCINGMTFRYKLKPRRLRDNTYFTSSGPLDIVFRDGRYHITARTPQQTWTTTLSETDIPIDQWTQLDVSWDSNDGLEVYVNEKLLTKDTNPKRNTETYNYDESLYLGRTNTNMVNEKYPNVLFDDVQIWESKKEFVPPAETVPPPRTTTTTRPPVTRVIRLDGTYWVTYDYSRKTDLFRIPSDYEQLHFQFRTDRTGGQLWCLGDEQNNMNLGLKNGDLVLTVNHGGGSYDRYRFTPASPLSDNRLHDVTVQKIGRQLTITVDGQEAREALRREFTMFRNEPLHIGGCDHDTQIKRNFDGSITEITIETERNNTELVDPYNRVPRPRYIYINRGDRPTPKSTTPTTTTTTTTLPPKPKDNGVTFTAPRAYLRLPKWDFLKQGSLEVKFKTRVPNGLLLYSGGVPGKRDFVAVEIYDGIPYFLIDLGDGVHRYPFTMSEVNDGKVHHIKVDRYKKNVKLTIDNRTSNYNVPSADENLDLGTFLYVGGYEDYNRLPWHTWTKMQKYFVGCIFDLYVNSELEDLEFYLNDQGRRQHIVPGCVQSAPDCGGPEKRCLHGVCKETYLGYFCDCSDTKFTGKHCDIDAPIARFYGRNYMRIKVIPTLESHTNDISLRFKTLKKDGLLFKTSNYITADMLELSVENGKGKMFTNLGGRNKTMFFCENLSDDEWHTLYVKRRADHFEAWVDNCPKSTVDLPNENYFLDIDQILVAKDGADYPEDKSFVGHMQNFYYDDKKFFEYIKGGYPGVFITGPDINDGSDQVVNNTYGIPYKTVTLRNNSNSFIQFSPLGTSDNLDITLMFNTSEPNGLLLFNEGKGGDFFTVYLSNGHMFLVAKGEDSRVITKISRNKVNDKQWHHLRIREDPVEPLNPLKLLVTLDGKNPQVVNLQHIAYKLDLSNPLYIGGLQEDMYRTLPSFLDIKRSFSGCLGTFMLSGQLHDMYSNSIYKTPFISEGCIEIVNHCKTNPCKNYGKCVALIDGYYCDCNMTSYTGRVCDEEAEGYRISPNERPGIMIYDFNPTIATDKDELAFGFMTWYPNGTLVRVDSGVSADFIEAKLENGFIVMSWDVGNGRQNIVFDQKKFNNGLYHYVRFIRNGEKAYMTVDDFPMEERIDQGGSGRRFVFDDMAVLKVGGNLDNSNRIIDHFNGIISGVYFNGTRFIDMGVIHGSPKIVTRGDIVMATHYFSVPRPSVPPPTDSPIVTPNPGVVPTGPTYITIDPLDPRELPGNYHGGGIAWAGYGPNGIIPPGQAGGGGTGTGGGGTGTSGGGTGTSGGGTGGGGGGTGTSGGGTGGGGGGTGGGVEGLVFVVEPGGGGVGVDAGVPVPGEVIGGSGGPLSAAAVSGGDGVGAGGSEGARAAGIAGAMLGILVAASSVMWATYKFKPGLLGLGGAGGAGGGGGAMNISSPSNYPLLKAAGGGGGGGGGGNVVAIEMNGVPPGGGYAATKSSLGTQTNLMSANLNANEFGASSSATASGIAGVIAGGGVVSRDVQTNLTSFGSGYGSGYGYSGYGNKSTSSTQMNGYSQFGNNPAATSTMMKESYHKSYYESTADGDVYSSGAVVSVARPPRPMAAEIATQTVMNAYCQTDFDEPDMIDLGYNTINTAGYQGSGYGTGSQASGYGSGYGGGYGDAMTLQSSSYYKENIGANRGFQTLPPQPMMAAAATNTRSNMSNMSAADYRKSMQHYHMTATNLFGAQSAQHQAAGVLMTSEEIRVDCVMLTQNGRYVVTGSIYGPPQIWDMKTGALVRLLEGSDLSSTDLHLACNDSLLVGQVAEMTQVDPSNPLSKSVHHRKIQIWDFDTGTPLEMSQSEICTASAMMSDGTRIVLGHTDKFGSGTSIVIWDILGNQPLRKIQYDGSIGFADYISCLKLSKDNRYVIAGFQNSYDGKANFLIFDLTVDDYTTKDPKILSLDAVAECSAILDNHEVVTGTKNGQLTIWSARTGKALRQLVSPLPLQIGGASLGRPTARSAHSKEVKAVEISHDGRILVSVSADQTVKIWNLENERLMFTLKGHTDEVMCCTISNDDEILVTGGKDGSIRLWKLQTGQHVTSYNTGVDVFTVKMSSDRRTVVALGDREGARKLIMLRVVVTKVRSRAGSRATSPQSVQSDNYHYSPY